jgi:sporulation protein YlmC with PRC-barrel domain
MSVRLAAAEEGRGIEDLTLYRIDAISARDAPDMGIKLTLQRWRWRKREGARCHDEGTHMKIIISTFFTILLALTAAQAQQPQPDVAPVTPPITGLDNAAWSKSARTSKLLGSKVYSGDTSIGQIEDVLVDLDSATVTAIILSVGGFLSIGNKLVAVPVNQIKVGSEAKFTTDLTKDQFSAAPAFDFSKLK